MAAHITTVMANEGQAVAAAQEIGTGTGTEETGTEGIAFFVFFLPLSSSF